MMGYTHIPSVSFLETSQGNKYNTSFTVLDVQYKESKWDLIHKFDEGA